MYRLQRRVEQQLGKHALAGCQGFAFQQGHPGRDILGTEMHVNGTEMLENTVVTG
ncbi:hypothetical protein D3C80_1752540 [compost metagenome]